MFAGEKIEAATVLRLFPDRPRVLALGEPTHGADQLLEARNDLFRQLVEQEGYRTIAIESDCLMGLVVDDYVTAGEGTLDEVMARGFSHEWGVFAGNRELVRWMRAHNDGRPTAEQVRFAGIDGPLEITGAASPRQAITALHGYLAARLDPDLLPCTAETLDRLLGDDGRWPNPAAMMDPSQSVGRTPEAGELRLLADDLVALLDAHAPQLADERASLCGRTAAGLLRYHYWMAGTSPGRIPRLLGQRSLMMAANLLAVAERGPVLVHAHNSHLQRNRSSMRLGDQPYEWWSAGAIVAGRLGPAYAVLASALGTFRDHGVDAPPPDTLEGLLYDQPEERYLVDPRRLDPVPRTARVSPWFGYAPLDPVHLPDGIVFVREVNAGGS
ncbi:erythromycin esterase-like protein [Actinoplanes tereljensis]|uniref:Erythromycin esterase n=1 Tax=Paractinoplanes tereljensis TaxID=571912 RepID=A0A919TQ93_9ACTN|nr:erythromycin esterase family protein [Actinoplanes tereljensis]GIF17914.1 erythromycin esterase [Actinoplanes tereljensis]